MNIEIIGSLVDETEHSIEIHIYEKGSKQGMHLHFRRTSIVEDTPGLLTLDANAEPYATTPCPCPPAKNLVIKRKVAKTRT